MIFYLDTSALAKLFISEPGSVKVPAAWVKLTAAATRRIAYVEMHTTAGQVVRMNRMAASSLEPRLGDLTTHWASLKLVDLT